MQSETLSSMVKKVFGDEDMKRQFMSDPESIISQFALTRQEKKAVMCAHRNLGLATGNNQGTVAIDPMVSWL